MKKEIELFNFTGSDQSLEKMLKEDYLLVARKLSRIFKEKLYRPQHKNFPDFVKDLGLSRGTATKLIQIHDVFVMKHGFYPASVAATGGWSVVSEVVALATTKKLAVEWLERVRKSKNRIELRKLIKKAKGHGRSKRKK